MSKADSLNKVLKGIAGVTAVIAGAAQVLGKINRAPNQLDISDLDCEWTCDNCGAKLNLQHGFRAGATWVCESCGYENDVSTDNIIPTRQVTDDRGDTLDILEMPVPWYDVGPEDY